MKQLFLFLLMLFVALEVLSQTILTKQLNSIRPGDKLIKQQVEFKDLGRNGSNVLWDFSKLKPINEKYTVRYYTPVTKKGQDSLSITCLENRTMYRYVMKGDSLLLMGFENPGSQMVLQKPEYIMHFPFKLGDSIVSDFKGDGSYNHMLSSGAEGKLYVVADAVGTLILPDGDTIKNVLRVKSQHNYQQRTILLGNSRNVRDKLSIGHRKEPASELNSIVVTDSTGACSTSNSSKSLSNVKLDEMLKVGDDAIDHRMSIKDKDSVFFRTENYRWYAPGYRYPLFETMHNFSRKFENDETEADDIATAFYFPPSQHNYLANDSLNKAVLDSIKRYEEGGPSAPSDSLFFDYNVFPNPVRTNMTIELYLERPSRVSLTVAKPSGSAIIRKDEGFYQPGLCNFSLNLSQLHIGYYILDIMVNDQAVQLVILKK